MNIPNQFKSLILFVSLLLSWDFISAFNFEHSNEEGIIRGLAKDQKTGELLVGATIQIKGSEKGGITGFDGSFVIKSIALGNYTLEGQYLGYKMVSEKVSIDEKKSEVFVVLLFEPLSTDIGGVNIIGTKDLRSEASVRASEKNSINVINVVGAKSIELSPDVNVANVVQRISGVVMERNSAGEAEYAILRGMDKRYNYTLVNGIKIPSPNNKYRYVPLNMFPSELVDRIEVTKSLTADMEGDATGGAINIEMRNAPSSFILQVNASLGYNSFYLDNKYQYFSTRDIIRQSPRELNGKDYNATLANFDNNWGKQYTKNALPNGMAGIALGNRFFQNRLGVILAGNFQNTIRGAESVFYSDNFSQQDNKVLISSMQERNFYERQTQYGAHVKADYRLNSRNYFQFYNSLMKMDNHSIRDAVTTNFDLFYDPVNNQLDLSYQTRLRTNFQNITVSNLKGEHTLSEKLSLQWLTLYSVAKHREPDRSYFNLDRITIGEYDNVYPDADGSTREWAFNSDRDISGFANLKYETELKSSKLIVKAGAMHRNKKRANSQVQYRFKPDGNFIQGQNFETLDEIKWVLQNPRGSVGSLEYDAYENISAAYAMGHLQNKLFDFGAGIRAEHTDQGYFMYFPGPDNEPNGNQKYVDLLPSFQVKFKQNKTTNWRMSYFKSINRPGFFELVPYLIIDEDFTEFGNKDIQRAKIDNFDLRWEYFPKPTEQILVGLFYKNLQNPIEMSYTTVNRRQYGYGPQNLGDATNVGLEIDYIKYIRNFGVKANYTYTLSQITTSKAYYAQDDRGNFGLYFQDQTRPLAGQSPHVANISLLYKNSKNGWNAQIASSYNHRKIIIASRFLDADYWQAGIVQFDASFEKEFKKGYSIFGKFNNIFNARSFQYILYTTERTQSFPGQNRFPDKTLIRNDLYGRTALIGFRYKLSK